MDPVVMSQISALVRKLGATISAVRRFWKDMRTQRAEQVRAARNNAEQLEEFAHNCSALLAENARARRAGDAIVFTLPQLDDAKQTGDDPDALELETAYRDLQREIKSANYNVDEISNDGYYTGPEEGLIVLEYRAWRVADVALKIAARYRIHYAVPRATLAPREENIEREILERTEAQARG